MKSHEKKPAMSSGAYRVLRSVLILLLILSALIAAVGAVLMGPKEALMLVVFVLAASGILMCGLLGAIYLPLVPLLSAGLLGRFLARFCGERIGMVVAIVVLFPMAYLCYLLWTWYWSLF